jgi:tellurite resistance protein
MQTMSEPAAPVQPLLALAGPGASLRSLPVNLFGAVMGLSGLALAWRAAAGTYGLPALIGEAIGAFALLVFVVLGLAYLGKLALHFEAVAGEFRHPVLGNFFGTIPIAVLLLSAVLAPYGEALAEAFWVAGSAATVLLGFVIVARLLRGNLDRALAVPAWLIPGVATLDIVVAGAHMPFAWAHEVNLFSLAVGAVLAAVFFTVIKARLIHREPLAPPMVPSLMILIAPFEVGFLAYTNTTGTVDAFASLLFYGGLFLFVVIAPKVFRSSVPFTPGFWAIGFPMAALANAALKYSAATGGWFLVAIADIVLAILTIALLVLTVRTLHMLFSGRLLAA